MRETAAGSTPTKAARCSVKLAASKVSTVSANVATRFTSVNNARSGESGGGGEGGGGDGGGGEGSGGDGGGGLGDGGGGLGDGGGGDGDGGLGGGGLGNGGGCDGDGGLAARMKRTFSGGKICTSPTTEQLYLYSLRFSCIEAGASWIIALISRDQTRGW